MYLKIFSKNIWVCLIMIDITSAYSENVQMYLVSILRIREEEAPVSLPDLAKELSISTAAVNEMCRKLEEQDLLRYRPYAGVSLTREGENLAKLILRKHRLWEVFLVHKLGYDYQAAHETACQLEHATPPHLADRLESYLERPAVNPQGEPIPYLGEEADVASNMPLSLLSPGEEAVVIHLEEDQAVASFLRANEIKPGSHAVILASGKENVLVRVNARQTTINRDIAERIRVKPLR